MAKPNRYRGGIATNLDLPEMTPAQRRQAEQDAYNDGLIQDAMARSLRDGPKMDVIGKGQHYTTTFDKLKELHDRGKPSLIPIAVQVGPEFPGGFHWILSDDDHGALMAGLYCPYCLDRYPEMWAPACTVCGCDRELLNH